MSLCLTPAELHELTDLEQPAAQIRWLREHGWVHEVGATGRPKVDRDYYRERMSRGREDRPQSPPRASGVDFGALDALPRRH